MGIKALQYSGDVFSGVGDVFELMLSIWAMSFARIQFLSRIKSIISGLNVYTNETLKASRIPRSFRVSPIPTTSIKLCFRGALPRRNNASLLFTLEIVKFKVRSRAGASIHEKAMHHFTTWGIYDLVLSAANLNAVHLIIRKGAELKLKIIIGLFTPPQKNLPICSIWVKLLIYPPFPFYHILRLHLDIPFYIEVKILHMKTPYYNSFKLNPYNRLHRLLSWYTF